MRHSIVGSRGFTLMELTISLTVIAILAAIAVPSYQDYVRRTYYSGATEAITPYKDGVIKCFQKKESLIGCNAGSKYIPAAMMKPKGSVNALTVLNGVITMTPVAKHGILATDDYIQTPVEENNALTWKSSGAAVKKGYID